VTKHEGLRSPKAIAFIQTKCSPRSKCLVAENYFIIRTPKSATQILQALCLADNSLNVNLTKNLGENMDKLKFAIPKGSLEKATADFFAKSGFKIGGTERTYRPSINDPQIEVKVLRPQEIPVFVSEGLQDLGITGEDWVRENRADVVILQNLEYGKIRLVIAVPKSVPEGTSMSDFMESVWAAGKNFRVSTEYLNIASEYLKSQPSYKKRFGDADPILVTPWWRKGDNPRAKIFLSFGATEAKPPENSDCIMDVTETGTTIEANNLRIIETVMRSAATQSLTKKLSKIKKNAKKSTT
jgi:ATP phosphoribosyltransferase